MPARTSKPRTPKHTSNSRIQAFQPPVQQLAMCTTSPRLRQRQRCQLSCQPADPTLSRLARGAGEMVCKAGWLGVLWKGEAYLGGCHVFVWFCRVWRGW